ncbi:MAG: RecQ family ATP-dependent DNA helicase [Candidatus Latescibacteria bacterium]|jgi:ATP-dependent DNA helicase RecQ|nr:RecQ family ATP-dependent DNA helicase [Candidatus Latescibacterota bacterium]MBT5829572.1 RecQ family ATP-dependent DNA helicase [Candidatus Latescibacterota bacterium]
MTNINTLLQNTFNLPTFRPGQEAVISALLAGRSALAVFPTGGGKSLCYQLPALALDGLTLVISPLIALMKDQVDALREKGIAAARLDSTMDYDAVREIYAGMNDGSLKLLYVAPERLGNERFLDRLRRQHISLLAVDEAHCISEWGHNFRPDYLKIARQAKALKVERVLALTATATPAVAKDICEAFDIDVADHVHTGFYRPNLTLKITPCSQNNRMDVLRARMKNLLGPTIVYVTLQKTAEAVAQKLAQDGIRAEAYHAGLKDDKRSHVQEAFMSGDVDVVVATIAFGMGIDKADIRAIYHYNLPKTLENYVQEIGRAGRDGEPSVCELLACADDCVTLSNFTYGDTPTAESVCELVAHLLSQGETFDVSQYELSSQYDIRSLVIATVLTYMELKGVLQANGPFYSAYKYQFKRPVEAVLTGYDTNRQAFLRALFDASKKGRVWDHLEPAVAAELLGEPRERIVAAVTYLEEQGDLEVQVTGLRHGFRRIGNPDAVALAEELVHTFARREEQDIVRLNQVVAFAEHGGCLTRHLLAYFGEEMLTDCGHCDGCDHPEPKVLPRSPIRALGDVHRDVVAHVREEGHEALQHPRQLSRFLCGLTSPATSRARLGRHARFGGFAELPFSDVLKFVEKI